MIIRCSPRGRRPLDRITGDGEDSKETGEKSGKEDGEKKEETKGARERVVHATRGSRCNERALLDPGTERNGPKGEGKEGERERDRYSHPLFHGSRALSLNAPAGAEATMVAALLKFSSLNFKRGGC